MIELYYTNAQSSLGDQGEPRKSLGGFVSSTRIPNDEINNVFDDVSLMVTEGLKRSTRAIAIKNVTGGQISDLSVYIDLPVLQYVEVELAFAAVVDNGNGPRMEVIDNSRAAPYVDTWYSPDSGDPLDLADPIDDGDYVGLWVRRKAIIPNVDVEVGTIALLDPGEELEVNGQSYTRDQLTNETFKLVFSWT